MAVAKNANSQFQNYSAVKKDNKSFVLMGSPKPLINKRERVNGIMPELSGNLYDLLNQSGLYSEKLLKEIKNLTF